MRLTNLKPWHVVCCFIAGSVLLWFSQPLSEMFCVNVLSPHLPKKTIVAIEFFIYDSIKLLLMLVGLIYLFSWVRAGLDMHRIQALISRQGKLTRYGLAAAFGAVTPFCSCSSIPLFMGFTAAGIPLGVTFSFLVTSPLINEVAAVMLWNVLGAKIALAYIAAGIGAGILAGILADLLRIHRWLQPFVIDAMSKIPLREKEKSAPSAIERHIYALEQVREICARLIPWILAGIGIGALIHGFVPQDLVGRWLARDDILSVPLAVLAGMPLYTNAVGIVPIMETLIEKGLSLGTVLAFSMSAVGASLPEGIMLSKVMTGKLLIAFFMYLLSVFTIIGWFFNASM